MSQRYAAQEGTFHVTTNTKGNVSWCTWPGIPELLIDNLIMTRNIRGARLYAFCILPDHVHIVMSLGEKGLSAFMHSFKRNAMRDVRALRNKHTLRSGRSRSSATEVIAWQKSFHDERIRDAEQQSNALAYVQYNAWRHGLTGEPNGWPWSSLHFPYLLSPVEI
jgi:REP element-mobilizing transposase RayT